ncbi:hypothetical protein [Lactobacillus terrae]|uniref:hypothetical protein n=1 Tax=Lactobacillus terrae TaxID=2269374 RepID=UPI000C1B72B5|nr:hypothetical protein [Lactobacillus terrae]
MKPKTTAVQITGYVIWGIETAFIILIESIVGLALANGDKGTFTATEMSVLIFVVCLIGFFMISLQVLSFFAIFNLHRNYSMVWPIILTITAALSFRLMLIPAIWGIIYNLQNKTHSI